jgi:tetratricopeptide (TPR) repeat protein
MRKPDRIPAVFDPVEKLVTEERVTGTSLWRFIPTGNGQGILSGKTRHTLVGGTVPLTYRLTMKTTTSLLLLLLIIAIVAVTTSAQGTVPTEQQQAEVQKAFETGNTLMEQRKYADALARYKEALAILPSDPSLLYNGGLAAYSSKDYGTAADLWKRLKAADPLDWRSRTKLIQAYQALAKLTERDAERRELFEMWKSGRPDDLKAQFEYCRDQFEVNGKKVMAFEHFELKGERALRYVFSILNEAGDAEDYRISLGSYELDQAIWRETTKPKPKEGERLFHLDGYFKWGHATYGFYSPEPSYDQVRARVSQILEGKGNPMSTTVTPAAKRGPKPKH